MMKTFPREPKYLIFEVFGSKAIKAWVVGTRGLNYWVLGPSGFHRPCTEPSEPLIVGFMEAPVEETPFTHKPYQDLFGLLGTFWVLGLGSLLSTPGMRTTMNKYSYARCCIPIMFLQIVELPYWGFCFKTKSPITTIVNPVLHQASVARLHA